MVAMDLGSFLDFGVSFDAIVLGIVAGVLILAAFQAAVLITAMLATRSNPQSSAPASGGAAKAGKAAG